LVNAGGLDLTGSSDNQWEFDGRRWSPHLNSDLPLVSKQSMAYDSSRGKMVLFGGDFADVSDRGTWEYNAMKWERRLDLGIEPSPRRSAAMVYDDKRKLMVLSGGSDLVDGRLLDDTWEYDGTKWMQADRAVHSHCAALQRHRLV
jgi:hypothetical protein